ncbi:hypothetical protein K7432_012500 [Basidiobolus ranarum]|uniref:Arrestin C-terminal-like domain-containing protein n=1 Tax=Basidiobolus ranarum TaxID=34480 RepID=A0ABR2WKU1_9FUNG
MFHTPISDDLFCILINTNATKGVVSERVEILLQPQMLFKIELNQDTFNSSYEDQEDRVFQVVGRLIFLPTFSMKITRIKLEFTGELCIRQELNRVRKLFYQHHWIFHGQAEGTQTFEKGRLYSYPFHLPIPGDIPESVDVDNARIHYQFRATAEAPLYLPNFKTSRDIVIRRHMGPTLSLQFNTKSQGIWQDALSYDISIPTSDYSVGSKIPIRFKLEKLTQQANINFIGFSLRERTMYRIPNSSGDGQAGTTVSEHRRWVKTEVSFFNQVTTQGMVELNIPKSPKKIHYDCITENVEVKHTLHIRLDFKYGRRTGNVLVVFPIIVKQALMNQLLITDAITEMLPCYDPSDLPPLYGTPTLHGGESPPSYEPRSTSIES